MDFMLELSPESLQISLMQPFPGTELYRKVKEKNLLVIHDLSKYDGYSTTPIRTETLSPEDLEQILNEANRRWHRHQLWKGVRKDPLQLLVYSFNRPKQAFTRAREIIFG
jgi:hypothetical protein